MIYCVYALQSLLNDQLYIGISKNSSLRLQEHNAGETKSTKGFKPFIKIYQEQCLSRIDARNREKYFKSGCGREFLKQYKKNI